MNSRDERFVANVVGVEYRSEDATFNARKMRARLIGALTPYQDYPEVAEELANLGYRFSSGRRLGDRGPLVSNVDRTKTVNRDMRRSSFAVGSRMV